MFRFHKSLDVISKSLQNLGCQTYLDDNGAFSVHRLISKPVQQLPIYVQEMTLT